MQDLTKNILSLDSELALVLQDAKAASMEAKKSADKYAEQMMKEAKNIFQKEKVSENKILLEHIEEEKKNARIHLDQKMKAFNERVNVDVVVGDLVSVAMDRICH